LSIIGRPVPLGTPDDHVLEALAPMADNKNDGSKSPEKAADKPGSDSSASKRPFATIDLKATEIKPPAAKPGDKPVAGSAAPAAGSAATPPKDTAGPTASASSPPPKASDAKGASASTEPKPAPAAAAPPPGRGRSPFGTIAAAILGGVIALAGNAFLAPLLPGAKTAPPPLSPEATQRFAALETAVKERAPAAAVPSDLADRLKALETSTARIEDVRKSLAALGETQSQLQAEARTLTEAVAKGAGAKDDVAERLGKLEATLAQIAAVANADPAKAAPIPQVTALVGRVADLESALATRLAELRKSVLADIDNRIAGAAEASEAAKAGTARIDRDVAALRSKADGTSEHVGKLATTTEALSQALKAVQEESGRIKVALDGVRADVDTRFKAVARPGDISAAVDPVAAKLSSLETSVSTVVKSEQDRRTNAERIVLALELGNLKRAMDRGGTYVRELTEVRKVAGKQFDLSVLERYQDKGVPTVAELARSFGPVANAILDAETARTDTSVFDRLVSGARTIVRVRKVAPAAGDDSVEAVVARMEQAVKAGRLTEVAEEAKKLSPKTAAPAHDWLERVEARAAVDRAVAALEGGLKTALGSAGGGPAAPAPAAGDKAPVKGDK
jgi:hypothetical protein